MAWGIEQMAVRLSCSLFLGCKTTKARLREDTLILEHPEVSLQISSPVGEFIKHLIGGFSGDRPLEIAGASFQLGRAELFHHQYSRS
jgi:CRISPR/Cas system endoribonuclease Cas6 (RAMP superfamily)